MLIMVMGLGGRTDGFYKQLEKEVQMGLDVLMQMSLDKIDVECGPCRRHRTKEGILVAVVVSEKMLAEKEGRVEAAIIANMKRFLKTKRMAAVIKIRFVLREEKKGRANTRCMA